MREWCKIIFLLTVIYSCAEEPIALKYVDTKAPGIKMLGSSYERDFYINEDIGDSLVMIWNNETNGSFSNNSPVLLDDYLFVNDLSGCIFAFNRKTGRKSGSISFRGEIAVTPIVNAFKLYFTLNSLRENYSILYSYDFMSGKVLSEYEFSGVSGNEMIFADEALYVLTEDGTLHKFNDVGFKLGELKTDQMTQCDPASDGKNIYWGNQKGEFISIDMKEMKINYRKQLAKPFESGVMISENCGYIGDTEGNLVKINLSNGVIIWETSTGTKIKSIPASDGESIFIGNLSGELYSVNINSGEIKFCTKLTGVLNAAPLVFNDSVILPNLNNSIHIINKKNGVVKKTIEFERRVKMTPVYYDSVIYIGADRGQIYAFKRIGLQ